MKLNTLQELMTVTMEECGELIQVCSKIMRKYDDFDEIDDSWYDKLTEEVGDVLCMIGLMHEHLLVDEEELVERVIVKRNKLKKWSKHIVNSDYDERYEILSKEIKEAAD